MSVHVPGEICPGCELKLNEGHPLLRIWFHKAKVEFKGLHISWVFRNKESQDLAVQSGKSRAIWPTSKHNFMKNGKPCALAMDLFELRNGVFYAGFEIFDDLNDFFTENDSPLEWGGKNPRLAELGDLDHFQLPQSILAEST